jgi:hypothetical protein
MTQSEMCQNWGYKRLGERTKMRAIEEMKHAEGLIIDVVCTYGCIRKDSPACILQGAGDTSTRPGPRIDSGEHERSQRKEIRQDASRD